MSNDNFQENLNTQKGSMEGYRRAQTLTRNQDCVSNIDVFSCMDEGAKNEESHILTKEKQKNEH